VWVQGSTTAELKGQKSEIRWEGTHRLLVRRIFPLVAEDVEQKLLSGHELALAVIAHHLFPVGESWLQIVVVHLFLRLPRAYDREKELASAPSTLHRASLHPDSWRASWSILIRYCPR
jgi:hypothetical protein